MTQPGRLPSGAPRQYRSRERLQSEPIPTPPIAYSAEPVDRDSAADRLDHMADAILARMRGVELRGAASVYAGCKLLDLAVLTSRRGYDPHTSQLGGHGTSDFPSLLEDVATKRFHEHLSALTPSFERLTRRISLQDFRPTRVVSHSGFPSTQSVNEGGEIEYGTLQDSGETLALATLGRIIGISRAIVVNDDVAAIDGIVRAAAQRAGADQNRLFWEIVRSNSGAGPVMADGDNYFHANHNNLMAGAALDATNFGTAAAALRNQVALDGETLLGIAPKFLVCGPANEVAGRTLITDLGAAEEIELIVDPAIGDGSWYIWANPQLHAPFALGTLFDARPYFTTRKSFTLDAIELKLRLDVAFGGLEWRAAVRTPAP